jgi:hypothetical protein
VQGGLWLGQAGGNRLPKQAELDPRVANVNGDERCDHFVHKHGLKTRQAPEEGSPDVPRERSK